MKGKKVSLSLSLSEEHVMARVGNYCACAIGGAKIQYTFRILKRYIHSLKLIILSSLNVHFVVLQLVQL